MKMNRTTAVFCLLTLFLSPSCAQEEKKEVNLPLKSIYEVTLEGVLQRLNTYGLKGPVKTVHQREYTTTEDSITNLHEYEISDISEVSNEVPLAEAGMTSDCTLTFDEAGRLLYRIAHGNRFASKAVETDTIIYDASGAPIETLNDLVGDDFSFFTHTRYEYDEEGHLVRQSFNESSTITYTYDETNNQVRVVRRENGDLISDYVYTYDAYGLNIETREYQEDGSLKVRWERQFDDQGRIKKETQYDSDGESFESKLSDPDQTAKVFAQYDTHGNCVKRLIIDPDGRTTVREWMIAYD